MCTKKDYRICGKISPQNLLLCTSQTPLGLFPGTAKILTIDFMNRRAIFLRNIFHVTLPAPLNRVITRLINAQPITSADFNHVTAITTLKMTCRILRDQVRTLDEL